jgi:hypothetical protein
MDMSKDELENALVNAMKKAMVIGEDSDDSMTTQDDPQLPPTEHLCVRIHQFSSSHENSIRVVLDDYLVESLMYSGTEQIGDQDQYALTPSKLVLSLSLEELTGNTWIEFLITNGGDTKPVSIWLRTSYIFMCYPSQFPLELELVDTDYRYVVRSLVLSEGGIFHFKNLGIQTII